MRVIINSVYICALIFLKPVNYEKSNRINVGMWFCRCLHCLWQES